MLPLKGIFKRVHLLINETLLLMKVFQQIPWVRKQSARQRCVDAGERITVAMLASKFGGVFDWVQG